MFDACFIGSLEHARRFTGVARQWFLAKDMFPGSSCCQARLKMGIVGRTVVKELDAVGLEHLFPIGIITFVPVSLSSFPHSLFTATGNRDQPRYRRWWVDPGGNFLLCI